MTTYIALLLLALLIIGTVVVLVRRERRTRDIEKRALARAIAQIDSENEHLRQRYDTLHSTSVTRLKHG